MDTFGINRVKSGGLGTGGPGHAAGAGRQAGAFAGMLQGAMAGQAKGAAGATTDKEARKAAGDLVAHALILPVLKQIRRGGLGNKTPFSPGIGENVFGPEFDMQIADRIAHSPKMQVTDALAERLQNRRPVKQDATGRVGAVNGQVAERSAGVDVHG